jgi:hypothetical protein
MRPHLVLALLLVLGGLARDGLPIVVGLISGEDVIGRVGAQLEVVRLQFLQLAVVELGLLHVLPSPKERLVGRRERTLIPHAQTATAERVHPPALFGIGLLGIVVLEVGGPVGRRAVAQIEMRGSLVHPCCYIYHPNPPQVETYRKCWKIMPGEVRLFWRRSERCWGYGYR